MMRSTRWALPSLLVALVPLTAAAAPLRVATVAAPDVHCLFDSDCRVTANDSTGAVSLPAASGTGFLQTRTLPPGEPGTSGARLHPYEYRLDLTNVRGVTAAICVTRMALDFGPVRPLDYDGDGDLDDVFVITRGGLGSAGLASADATAGRVTLTFRPAVCPGETSYFIGLASAAPPRPVQAELTLTAGLEPLTADARAPQGSEDEPDRWSDCTVEPGDRPVPIPRFVPLCRCLRDATVREFRCALLHPDFFLIRRIPWPVPPGPFTERWSLRPLSPLDGPVAIQSAVPPGYGVENIAPKTPVRFSADVPVGSEATVEVPYRGRPNAGSFDVDARLEYGQDTVELRFVPGQ